MRQATERRWTYLPELAGEQLPRYTSYPPANRFSPDISETDVAGELLALPADADLSIYIHIPYCKQLCWYCGCHASVPTRANPLDSYVDALLQEFDLVSARLDGARRVSHVHFGGGSPNVLTPEQIDAIFGRLNDCFALAPDAEICAEFDPRSLPAETLEAYAGGGLTRASLGVQVLDAHVQALINRKQPVEVMDDVIGRLRQAGVDSINMDVMYGLPEQNLGHVMETASYAADRGADRIAVFGYAHVPWFRKHQGAIQTSALPQSEERFRQAEAAAHLLEDAGYRRVGFDHFALPGDDLAEAVEAKTLRRNFQGYTADTADNLIAFGASSISSVGRLLFQNAPDTAQYRQRMSEGRLATVRGTRLSDADVEIGRAISDILCHFEAELPDALMRRSRDGLLALQSLGVVRLSDRRVRVTDKGAPYVRNVAAAMDPEFAAGTARHSLAV